MNGERKNEGIIPLGTIQNRIIFLAILGILGGPGVFNAMVPGVFGDSELHKQIDLLKDEIEELNDRINSVELEQQHIISHDFDCLERQKEMHNEFRSLRELVTSYQSAAKQRDNQQDKLISECMKDKKVFE